MLLALLALLQLRRPQPPLDKDDRTFIGILLLYLISTVISNTLSGWTYASVRWYEADLRLLLGIPIFLLLRSQPNVIMGLLRAVPIAALLAGGYAVYLRTHGAVRVDGPYGPIFLGNIAALLAVVSVATVRYHTYPLVLRIPLHLAGAAAAVVASVLSGTRSAWLAAAVALPVALLFSLMSTRTARLRRHLSIGTLGFVGAVVALTLIVAPMAPKRIEDRALASAHELTRFFSAETNEQREAASRSSAGIRLEQWRTGLLIASEQPLFGVGVGNVSHEINRHVRAGTASPAILVHDADEGRGSHLHSAYFDALTFKGGLGLATLLLLIGYPLYLGLQRGNRSRKATGLLMANSVAFGIFCLTEDPFIRNNFSSVFMVFTLSALILLSAERAVPRAFRAPAATGLASPQAPLPTA